jgi:hypothetical protein
MATNLTKSSYQIFLQDADRILDGIYWETCSPISAESATISTSNGKDKFTIPTRPQPKAIDLSRASNIDDDFKINQWLNTFSGDRELIGGVEQGTVLILVPLKPGLSSQPYSKTIKVFNCVPTSFSLFDADIMNVTDVSRTTVSISWTHFIFS